MHLLFIVQQTCKGGILGRKWGQLIEPVDLFVIFLCFLHYKLDALQRIVTYALNPVKPLQHSTSILKTLNSPFCHCKTKRNYPKIVFYFLNKSLFPFFLGGISANIFNIAQQHDLCKSDACFAGIITSTEVDDIRSYLTVNMFCEKPRPQWADDSPGTL